MHKIFPGENTPFSLSRGSYIVYLFGEVIAEQVEGSGEGGSQAGGLEWLENWWEEVMAECWALLEGILLPCDK